MHTANAHCKFRIIDMTLGEISYEKIRYHTENELLGFHKIAYLICYCALPVVSLYNDCPR